MNDNYYDIAIIGGGAAGLMLAANFDLDGSAGIILEGGERPGTKLLMSGGGHCNLTHGGSMKDFIGAYSDAGPLLRKCLYRHSNYDLACWMEARGVKLSDEDGRPLDLSEGIGSLDDAGRVFPASMKAADVLDTFISEASENGWQIETGSKVCGLRKNDGAWEITLLNGYELNAAKVVAATGGITYPATGSDGSMLEILEDLGIEITEPRPALSPVYVSGYPYSELAGVSLPEVTVLAFRSGMSGSPAGRPARMKGDLLFTHEGFSGPVILNISRYAEPGEILRLCYNREYHELPKRMQRVLRDRARGPVGDVRTRELAALIDHDDFTVDRVDDRGMVTAGGVALKEIDLLSMKIKDPGYDGLYVIGEALDADGITGGYNLQLCWSTACAAADDIKRSKK